MTLTAARETVLAPRMEKRMYKHILLPTDGSALSRKACRVGVRLAQSLGATVLAVHVVSEPHPDLLADWIHHDPAHTKRWQELMEQFGEDYLKAVAEEARSHQVHCICRKLHGADVAAAIARAAVSHGCDLIHIASHGWTDREGAAAGSVMLRVVHDSAVPVLVYKRGSQLQEG